MTEYRSQLIGPQEPYVASEKPNLDFTRILLDKYTVDLCNDGRVRYTYVAYCVSNLSHESLQAALPLLKSTSPFFFNLSVQTVPHVRTQRPVLAMFWDQAFKFNIDRTSGHLGGNYLRVLVGTACKDCYRDTLPEYGREYINRIRLVLGNDAAAMIALEDIHDLTENTTAADTTTHIFPELAGIGNDISSYIDFHEGPETFRIDVPKDVNKLLEIAFSSRTPWERLLFLWIAIEAKIGEYGDDRKRFFLGELRSEKANSEALRLRNLRVGIVHKGVLSAKADDCISALWIFRLCCVPESDLRRNLLSKFEEWVSSPDRTFNKAE